MILGFRKALTPNQDSYWFGKVNSVDKKFIRVIAGLITGKVSGQVSAMVVLAELYRSISPMDLTAVGAFIDNDWLNIRRNIEQYARDLQFNHIVVESEDKRKMLWRVPEIGSAITETAPHYALEEVGLQKVNSMIGEGKLHLDTATEAFRHEPEQGARAIQLAVCWAQEWPAIYRAARKSQAPEYKTVWGMTGLA